MSDFAAGEKLFKGLLEYELPADGEAGDYVFHFAPVTVGYGLGGLNFFNKFYKKHISNPAGSLEEMVSILIASIANEDASWIREIIIVCHATPYAAGLPLMKTIPADRPQFKILTPNSLIQLQKDFLAGRYPDFNKNRKAVVKLLKLSSWVTMRCCNFGQNKNGLYAFYSFFGGLANLYAPRRYQFFGDNPVVQDSVYTDPTTKKQELTTVELRFADPLQVHEHLIRQRFFPNDNHTPDRKIKLITDLMDPEDSSDPFQIAKKQTGASDTDATNYDSVITDLNNRTISEFVKAQFLAANFELTGAATAKVFTPGSRWLIGDTIEFNADMFVVEYRIETEPADASGLLTILANAHLTEQYSAQHSIQFQLFMTDEEDRKYKGWLFFLSAYVEDPDAPAEDETRFAAINILLEANQFTNGTPGTFNIKDSFKDDLALTDNATIALFQAGDSLNPRIWIIKDTVSYLVKKEDGVSSDGKPAHAFSVYQNLNDKDLRVFQYKLISSTGFGQDPDNPGTELMASLDQIALDDLLDLIDFLRNPYDPDKVVYLHHAQEALQRKKEFLSWYDGQPEQVNAEKYAMVNGGYANLSIREWVDNVQRVYEFNANLFWAEVKSSNPTSTTILQDLFTEELLNFDETPDMGFTEDGPFANRSELQKLEAQGLDKYFSNNKNVIDPPSKKQITCEQYKALLAKMKELGTTDPNELLDELKNYKVDEQDPMIEYLTEYKDFNILKITWDFLEIGGEVLAESEVHIVSHLGEVIEGGFGFAFGLGLAVADVFLMEYHIIQDEEKADEAWERKGKCVAVRQWARELEFLASRKSNVFTPPITIDYNVTSSSLEPYYIRRYFEEQLEQAYRGGYSPYVWSPEDYFKNGFDEGWAAIEKAGNEVLSKIGDYVDEALQQGGLDPCMISALHDSGLLDMNKITNAIMGKFAKMVIQKCPDV
jgi:hypothetical protein